MFSLLLEVSGSENFENMKKSLGRRRIKGGACELPATFCRGWRKSLFSRGSANGQSPSEQDGY